MLSPTREVQIKTTLRFYLTPVIMATVEETNNSKWREDVVQSEPLDAAGGNLNSAATMELSVGAPEGKQK